jgi:soluble lytic murein transglycosylase
MRTSQCRGHQLSRLAALGLAALALGGGPAAAQAPEAKAPKPAATPAPVQPAPRTEPAVVAPPARPAAETRYFAEMDKAIAAVRDLTATPEDGKRLEALAALAGRREGEKAAAAAAEIVDPLARKLGQWLRLRNGLGDIRETRAFLAANPGWPDGAVLTRRIEEQLLAAPPGLADLRATVGGDETKTSAGLAAFARAHLAAGDKVRAAALAKRAWADPEISASEEALILQHLGALLEPADHKLRLDRLLVDDERWARDRTERAAVVRRLIPLLPEAEKSKAEARLAVFLRAKNAKALITALPSQTAADWGLVFQKVQEARRADRHQEAWALLRSVPAQQSINPDGWWLERRANAYAALEQGQPKTAYELVRDAGALSVNPRKEQAFLAGWLAFRHLGDAKTAARHFEDMRKAADGPLSRSKAEYWSGRVLESLGEESRAREHYTTAARLADTLHGQLALAKLKSDRNPFGFAPPAAPSAAQIKAFESNDAVRAAIIAHKAGLVGPARTFLFHLARTDLAAEPQAALLAHLAESLGDTQAAVRIGKAAIGRGHYLVLYAYPTHPMPAYAPLRDPPESAFLLAIARQETEFNNTIVSGAGARGLLQVMPVTAKHVCGDYKIRCDIPRLLTDNAYNARIASAYIGDRMAEFAGSYVLTLSGYNAGPGRTRQWIRQFGDPRDPKVDPIDWIERIPFEETREYVAKVLSNVQVYRALLSGGTRRLEVMADLARARGQMEPVKSANSEPPKAQ